MNSKLTKKQKKLHAFIHRQIADELVKVCLFHFRKALELEGFHGKIRRRKDGKIVMRVGKPKRRKRT